MSIKKLTLALLIVILSATNAYAGFGSGSTSNSNSKTTSTTKSYTAPAVKVTASKTEPKAVNSQAQRINMANTNAAAQAAYKDRMTPKVEPVAKAAPVYKQAPVYNTARTSQTMPATNTIVRERVIVNNNYGSRSTNNGYSGSELAVAAVAGAVVATAVSNNARAEAKHETYMHDSDVPQVQQQLPVYKTSPAVKPATTNSDSESHWFRNLLIIVIVIAVVVFIIRKP